MSRPTCATCLWAFTTWRDYLCHRWLHVKAGR